MNEILTADKKIKIINIVINSKSKEELKSSVNNLLNQTNNQHIPETIPSIIVEESVPPKVEEIKIETPSIYSQEYKNLVEMDRQAHPRDKEKLKIEVPEDEESEAIKSTSPSYELNTPLETTKVLEKKLNNPWASSGAKVVSPGELNLN